MMTYFINAGYDNDVNKLIYCSGLNCSTLRAVIGYYVGNEGNSLISCTSEVYCMENLINNEYIRYINGGTDNINKPLIKCQNNVCSTEISNDGYYISSTSSILISCIDNKCSEKNAIEGYYYSAENTETNSYIIHCDSNIDCNIELSNRGYYISNVENILINCMDNGCKRVLARYGIYNDATFRYIKNNRMISNMNNNKNNTNMNMDMDINSDYKFRTELITYNLIKCTRSGCSQLTLEELALIPICSFDNDKCFIIDSNITSSSDVKKIDAGGYCTNKDRSIIYYATNSISVESNVISVDPLSENTYTTTNCIEVSEKYNKYYFTVSNNIYHIDEGQITEFVNPGYYFIDESINKIVDKNDINKYNQESVKLFMCDGTNCEIVEKPSSTTFYADVNKNIIQYNNNSKEYTFIYEKEIICVYSDDDNMCTPNADIKENEFCITYKGELVLISQNTKAKEKGSCLKANSITDVVYGSSKYLYKLNSNSASIVYTTTYYLMNKSTKSIANEKLFDEKYQDRVDLQIYSCDLAICKTIEQPEDKLYYYDSFSHLMYNYDSKRNKWGIPKTSGYAYIAINPKEKYVYKYSMDSSTKKITIGEKAENDFYYTINFGMVECNDERKDCQKINESDYYLTKDGNIYYCVYDSEEVEETECKLIQCLNSQYYYIRNKYYVCKAKSNLVPITSDQCSSLEKVIINFLPIQQDEWPEKIKNSIGTIKMMSTPSSSKQDSNSLPSISGIFTNCTYNENEKETNAFSYDLVCIKDDVSVNNGMLEICSLNNLGFIECSDDDHTGRCNVSSGIRIFMNWYKILILFIIILSLFHY